MPVLWITSPAGVGKSTVSWQLFTELAGSGTRVAFADADQLCMCYPPPPDDPGRDRIRARNAGVVIGNYQAAGAQRVIVNGVADPVLGVQRGLIEQAELMVCRLRADRDEVVRRFTGRHQRSGGDLRDAVRQARDECDRMDTTALATCAWIRPAYLLPRWPGSSGTAAATGPASATLPASRPAWRPQGRAVQ